MSATLAAALGGAAGAVALVGIVFILVRYFLSRHRSISRTSETNSSDPSVQVGQNIESPLAGGVTYAPDFQGARCFTLNELNLATKNFNNINLIGCGMFGEVYKGLLRDGLIVAVKRRPSVASQEFIEEVRNLSLIRHRNVVSLLGYCQENDLQMLVSEYIPNGSVSLHIYGAIQPSSGKLEFKHRLSIALGAAKGMTYLHSLNPPLLHKAFKTENVLVDEDFVPKVADAGLKSLLDRIDGSGSSSKSSVDDPFLDPETKESGSFSVKSDVYSFGIFLLELVSGKEARYEQSIIEWAQSYQEPSNIAGIVDPKMGSSFTPEGMREFLRLMSWCVNPSGQGRPPMNFVELELNRIREKEMSLTTIMGEGTTTVTLGSQLFTSVQ